MEYHFPSTAYRILLALYDGNKRFRELAEIFPKATVAKILPDLEKYKYVDRHVTNTRPLQVTYSITENGKKVVDDGLEEALEMIRNSIKQMYLVNQPEVFKVIKGLVARDGMKKPNLQQVQT